MGLVKLDFSNEQNIFENEILDYIYCEPMGNNVRIRKGIYKSNANDETIIDGSNIKVEDGQFLIIAKDYKIVDFTSEPGDYRFDFKIPPLLLCGKYENKLINSFQKNMSSFIYDGTLDSSMYAYFVNTHPIKDNKFATFTPIEFKDYSLNTTIEIKCYGKYTIEICDPVSFYNSYGKNILDDYVLSPDFEDTFLLDFLYSIHKSLENLFEKSISYDMITSSKLEITDGVRKYLKNTWGINGVNVLDVSIASVTPTIESVEKIKNIKENKLENFSISDKDNNINNSGAVIGTAISDPSIIKVNDTQKICPNCQTKLVENANFCPNCGQKL